MSNSNPTEGMRVVNGPNATNLESPEPRNASGFTFPEWRRQLYNSYEAVSKIPITLDMDAAFKVFEADISAEVAVAVLTSNVTVEEEQAVKDMINAMRSKDEPEQATTRRTYHERFMEELGNVNWSGEIPRGLVDHYWRTVPNTWEAVNSFLQSGPPADFKPVTDEEVAEAMLDMVKQRWGAMPAHPADGHVVALSEEIIKQGRGSAPIAVGIERLFKEVYLAFDAGLRLSDGTDRSAKLLEEAWGIIANASGGDWDKENPHWKSAAERFRDRYHRQLNSPQGMYDKEEELEAAMKDPRYFVAVVGPVDEELLPSGADAPLRKGVEEGVRELFGQQPIVINTGWGVTKLRHRRVCSALFRAEGEPAVQFPGDK